MTRAPVTSSAARSGPRPPPRWTAPRQGPASSRPGCSRRPGGRRRPSRRCTTWSAGCPPWDPAALIRGEALIRLERFDEAAGVLATIPLKSFVGWDAARERARALREGGRVEEARASYQALIASGRWQELPVGLLGLARLEADGGQTQKAVELLRRLDLERPEHWTAREGRSLAEKLVAGNVAAERLWRQRTVEEEVARGEKLADANKNEQAVEVLAPLTSAKLPDAVACRQRYALARCLRKLRKWKEALPRVQEAVTKCTAAKSELAPWALHLAGQATERLSLEDEAAAHYREQMKAHPEHRLADDAGFFLVRHYLDDKKDYKAARSLVETLVAKFPDGDMVPEALFFVVIEALKEKRYSEARDLLALEDRLPPRSFEHHDGGRTEYWLARLDELTGKRREAVAGYSSVLSTAPFSWYAILAYSRLRDINPKLARDAATAAQAGDPPGPTLPSGDRDAWAFTVPPEVDGPALDQAIVLARLGVADLAVDALKAAGVGDRPDLLWLQAWMLDRAGAYTRSHDILRRKLGEFRRFAPHANLRKHWNIAFPTPFGSLVKAAAKKTGVDRFFIWGIMREESGFNAAVASWASAVGLMQLILPTARSMQEKKEKPITREGLKVPATNVRLGSKYLATVKEKSGAPWALVPAGYNAGYGALKKWLAARGDLDLDLFVETIPYEEARWYTKRVISSFATYRALYGGRLSDPLPYIGQRTKD
ncbi:MAG: transglycosylase SLT domain-containing protein [bacterium]